MPICVYSIDNNIWECYQIFLKILKYYFLYEYIFYKKKYIENNCNEFVMLCIYNTHRYYIVTHQFVKNVFIITSIV